MELWSFRVWTFAVFDGALLNSLNVSITCCPVQRSLKPQLGDFRKVKLRLFAAMSHPEAPSGSERIV